MTAPAGGPVLECSGIRKSFGDHAAVKGIGFNIARGETYVSPAIVTRMVNTYVLRTPGAPIEDAYDSLTEREKEVLLLAAVGHTNREIAGRLQRSERTI
ncbi:MAG: LuxR C-terminal-related transcriptional regulator, partial [Acidimicrobiia bacterium]|nr:LuxR C-terminal-related transcriptional regulator [Acidimicrobiia bacterium]